MTEIRLFHGSSTVIREPKPELCRPHNDYGRGFYCTRSIELAKEWACKQGQSGFANAYDLELYGLSILDLNNDKHTILHWLEVLISNRVFSMPTHAMELSARWLHEHFAVDTKRADIIRGYRADDSYFGFARAFLRNEITLDQLSRAMHLGELGEQYMIKSKRGFAALRYVDSTPAAASEYWTKRTARDESARDSFKHILHEDIKHGKGVPRLYITTLMDMEEDELSDSIW